MSLNSLDDFGNNEILPWDEPSTDSRFNADEATSQATPVFSVLKPSNKDNLLHLTPNSSKQKVSFQVSNIDYIEMHWELFSSDSPFLVLIISSADYSQAELI